MYEIREGKGGSSMANCGTENVVFSFWLFPRSCFSNFFFDFSGGATKKKKKKLFPGFILFLLLEHSTTILLVLLFNGEDAHDKR